MRKLRGIINIILGALVAVGTQTFLFVCGHRTVFDAFKGAPMGQGGHEEMAMPCAGVPTASFIAGIILALAGVLILFTEFKRTGNKPFAAVPDAASLIIGVVTIGIPTFITGVCPAQHMHCHAVTRPALILLGALTAALSIPALIKDIINIRLKSLKVSGQTGEQSV